MKVSIIIPIYNVEKYLRQCLDSIINQTLTDLEIICINDGSKDSSPQILEEYAQKDERIKIINKANSGYGASMNVGLDNATGEYIGIVEPDDYISKDMYNDLYKIASEYDSDIVKSLFYDNLDSPKEKRVAWIEWDEIPEDRSFTLEEYPYFMFYHPSAWSAIYKRTFLIDNKIRFVEAPGAGWTDNPFQVQTMCCAKKINYTSKAYYYWRRVNVNESDDLKDYRIPFLRTNEIHNWLKQNNITNEGIWANLYRRELAYINIILGMKNIKNIQDCYENIKSMCKQMDKNIIDNSPYFYKSERAMYYKYMNHLKLIHFFRKISSFRKYLFQIHWNKKSKYIKIFGNVYYRKHYADVA